MKKNPLFLSLLCIGFLFLVSGCNSKSPGAAREELPPIPQELTPDWIDTAIIYEVNVRQYTEEGTFNAFSAHLDRLQALGINTLWFMPIHPISEEKRLETLGSYYSVADYYGINPEFGDADDFKELVDLSHEKGFKVMLDWVANHTGWDNPWITQHPDWYANRNGIILQANDWSDVAQLNYRNADLRREMIKAMTYWVREFDVDGFRCDYAEGVPADFWETARNEISRYKKIYMLAEAQPVAALLKSAFDSYYNWRLYQNALKRIAGGSAKASSVRNYIPVIGVPEGRFPLNFMDNHDENSWNGTTTEIFGTDAIPAFTALIFTLPGVPLVYSGHEAGLAKRLAFFEKDEIPWDEFPYQELITKLAGIKITNPALHNGSAGGIFNSVTSENEDIIAFESVKGNDKITVIINLSGDQQSETNNSWGIASGAMILLNGDAQTTVKSGESSLSFEELQERLAEFSPWEYYVISSTNDESHE